MPKMTDADLRTLVAKRRDASFVHVSGALARDRRTALQFYRGDNLALYGDSGAGLSTVVSRDLMEAVESSMPSLLKPFVSGDEVVRFDPRGPEDEEPSKQATDYINYLFFNHNDGFRVIYDSLKDGLLYRYGVAKVVVEEVTETEFETYQGLGVDDIAAIDADKALTIIDNQVTQEEDGSFTVQVQRTSKRKLFRVIVVSPEKFLHEPRIASLDEGTFFAHHEEKTVGDLIEMGLPADKCRKLPAGSPVEYQEEDARFTYEPEESLDEDDLARKVWVDDCYIRCGDPLRWRRVVMAGADNTILLNEEADDHPFEGWTPLPEPHKLIGQGMYDLVRDIQMSKTAVKREAMNALYLANRPMKEVVEGKVNLDDLLSPGVDAIVRVKEKGMISPLPSATGQVLGQSLTMIEALDSEREARTGVTRYNQGMDANSLNKTATGVSIITNASQQRQELIARNYAESFLKGVFRKMLKLVSRHKAEQEVIRLRGEWVEMDPREWKTGYDMSIAVGLGTGNKDQQVAHLNALTAIQAQIAQAQDGFNGPLLTWENVYNTVKMFPEAMGLKGAEKFFTDPSKAQEQGAEPDEAAQAQQAELQAAQAQAEAENQRHASELVQKHDTAVEVARIDAEAKIEVAKIGAEERIIIAQMQPPPNLVSDGQVDGDTAPTAPQEPPMAMPEPVVEGGDFAMPMEPMPELPPEEQPL